MPVPWGARVCDALLFPELRWQATAGEASPAHEVVRTAKAEALEETPPAERRPPPAAFIHPLLRQPTEALPQASLGAPTRDLHPRRLGPRQHAVSLPEGMLQIQQEFNLPRTMNARQTAAAGAQVCTCGHYIR